MPIRDDGPFRLPLLSEVSATVPISEIHQAEPPPNVAPCPTALYGLGERPSDTTLAWLAKGMWAWHSETEAWVGSAVKPGRPPMRCAFAFSDRDDAAWVTAMGRTLDYIWWPPAAFRHEKLGFHPAVNGQFDYTAIPYLDAQARCYRLHTTVFVSASGAALSRTTNLAVNPGGWLTGWTMKRDEYERRAEDTRTAFNIENDKPF